MSQATTPPSQFNYDAIPHTLRKLRRWLRWELARNPAGKWTKVPDSSTSDPRRQRTFTECSAALTNDSQCGPGFIFTGGVDVEDGRIYALDLDGCRDPETGSIEDWARLFRGPPTLPLSPPRNKPHDLAVTLVSHTRR